VALMQEDIKKLIAYSSVAHMGYVTMGIFAMNEAGMQGAIFQMLSARPGLRRAVPLRRRRL
jgi:NADH-quinone oxidoreductase subunit M